MLADVVRKAADLLAQAAAKLEGNLNRFSAQAGSMTGAAQRLTASAARLPAARLGQAMAGAAAGGQQQPGAPQTAGPFATLQAQYQSSLGRLQSQVRQAPRVRGRRARAHQPTRQQRRREQHPSRLLEH